MSNHREKRIGLIEVGARSDRQLYILLCLLSLGFAFIARLIVTEAIRQAQIKEE